MAASISTSWPIDMALTPAAELMNRTYRHQRHVYDFTRKYYLLGRDQVIASLDPPDGGRVLEIGCGTGRNLVAAAQRFPGASFFGVDVSTEMLASAIRAISRAGLASRVRVANADATRLDAAALFGTPQFDRIFISYSLSMIPDWQGAVDVAFSLLATSGELRIVDFGGQERLPPLVRTALRRWLALFHVTPCDGLEAFLRRRSVDYDAALSFERPWRGYAQCAALRRRAIHEERPSAPTQMGMVET
jgi:S-adenosylmethionine-diacylgycerolhomoserine-N-methlytransferase